MNKDELRQMIWDEQMNDSTTYCCYCGQEQRSFGCCGENHFETFADMYKEDQDAIVDALLEDELAKEQK
jgi:hypothetical protein